MVKDRPEKGKVTLFNVKPAVRSVLEASGFDQVLSVQE